MARIVVLRVNSWDNEKTGKHGSTADYFEIPSDGRTPRDGFQPVNLFSGDPQFYPNLFPKHGAVYDVEWDIRMFGKTVQPVPKNPSYVEDFDVAGYAVGPEKLKVAR